MAEFRREKVLFTVIGQGEVDIEYAAGEETPEQAFRRAYDSNHGRPHKVRHFDLRNLILEAEDFDWVITVATEPDSLNTEREADVERERDDIEHTRAREDEDDQWRMNRLGSD